MKDKTKQMTLHIYFPVKWQGLYDLVKASAEQEDLHVSQYIKRCLAEKLNFKQRGSANPSPLGEGHSQPKHASED